MSKWYQMSKIHRDILSFAAASLLGASAFAQAPAPLAPPVPQAPPGTQATPPAKPGAQSSEKQGSGDSAKGETHITPEQAKQLFGMVDVLLKFSSQESGFPDQERREAPYDYAFRCGELSAREV